MMSQGTAAKKICLLHLFIAAAKIKPRQDTAAMSWSRLGEMNTNLIQYLTTN